MSTVASCKNPVTFACAPPGTKSWRRHWTTEIVGVDSYVAPAKKQGLKTRELTSRHEETRADNAGLSDLKIMYFGVISTCLKL